MEKHIGRPFPLLAHRPPEVEKYTERYKRLQSPLPYNDLKPTIATRHEHKI
jgi:hypothetical protein